MIKRLVKLMVFVVQATSLKFYKYENENENQNIHLQYFLKQVPDTGFGCDGRVEGGYYADTSAECQVKSAVDIDHLCK